MDVLHKIVLGLTRHEVRELKYYLNRNSARSEKRKDVQLLELLRKNPEHSSEQIMLGIYASSEKTAYYHLRENLKQQVEEFMLLQRSRGEAFFTVTKFIATAQYLFKRNLVKEGWEYLQKAEKEALQYEEFELLNLIYYTQLENAFLAGAPLAEDVISKRQLNLKLAKQDGNLNVARQLIVRGLTDAYSEKETPNIDQMVNQVFSDLEIRTEEVTSPRLRLRLIEIKDRVLFEKGKYEELESYLLEEFAALEELQVFNRFNQWQKIILVRNICYILLRNSKFRLCEDYIGIYMQELERYNKKYYPVMFADHQTFLAEVTSYQGRFEESLKILTQVMEDPPTEIPFRQQLIFQYLIMGNHFRMGNYREAIRAYGKIGNDEEVLMKQLEKKAVIDVRLCECILHIDAGNYDYALTRLDSIERKVRDMLQQPAYKREQYFIQLLKQMCLDPKFVRSKRFKEEATNPILLRQIDATGSELIQYHYWLRSKVENRPFAEVFIEEIEAING
jgi:hypothetical protein